MNTLQSEQPTSSAHIENSVAIDLPIEIVLDILDAAIVLKTKADLSWSLSLSLVCRRVRACVLPIAYEVVYLDCRGYREGGFTGWDGRLYKDPQLAFLSWLLHDPNAPPRQHIKHLIFRGKNSFNEEDIAWADEGKAAGTTDPMDEGWAVEQLSVRLHSLATKLYHMGLRPGKTFRLCHAGERSDIPVDDPFAYMVAVTIRNQLNLYESHAQLWVTKKPGNGDDPAAIWQSLVMRYQFNRLTGKTVVSANGSGRCHTYHLDETSFLLQRPDLLRAGILEAFARSTEVQVVLACRTGCRIAGQTIEEFVRATIPANLLPSVEGRIRVSHAAMASLVEGDMFRTMAHASRSGGDLWDRGHPISFGFTAGQREGN